MKRSLIQACAVCLSLLLAAGPVSAQADYVQLPKSDADRQTFFNNITDSLATFGKSGKEKERVIKQRKADRRAERLRKQRRSRDAKVQKQIRQQERVIMKKIEAKNKAKYSHKKKKSNKEK